MTIGIVFLLVIGHAIDTFVPCYMHTTIADKTLLNILNVIVSRTST